MKCAFLALVLLFSSVAIAEPTTVTDIHGKTHYTGYLGVHALQNGEAKHYWSPSKVELTDVPANYDSRKDNYVAPIKNQGSCGSCWDFSMTKSYESARLLAGQTYLDFAEQDVLVNDKKAYGCSGGFMDAHYFVDHGVTSEANCPYKASGRYGCNKAPVDKKAVSWGYVGAEGRQATVEELKAAIYKYKVISVTVAAGGSDWNGGNGGKMTSCRTTGINHMVNAVGYTTDANGSVTFIGANSWGTDWGDNGFFYAKQGCNQFIQGADSALYVVYEADVPVPTNPPTVHVASDVTAAKGVEVPVGVKAEQGVTYSWSTGATDSLIWVKADQDATLELKGTNNAGTSAASVNIHVLNQ